MATLPLHACSLVASYRLSVHPSILPFLREVFLSTYEKPDAELRTDYTAVF